MCYKNLEKNLKMSSVSLKFVSDFAWWPNSTRKKVFHIQIPSPLLPANFPDERIR